jgi:alpha-beta hydrolase superfamily lysophospholipase
MHRSEEIFQGQSGLDLYSQSWHPSGKTKAKLAIVHGIAEHSDRYLNLVNGLVEPGYALYAYDQRGHGKSEGQRGYIQSWSEYRADLDTFLNLIRERDPSVPLFLYGHSMGALVILDYLLHEPNGVQGIILSGSPIDSSQATSPALILTARLLSRIWPTFSMATPIQPAQLSCDARVVQAYQDDPSVFKVLTVRWGTEYLATQEWVKDHASEIDAPVLILHGGEDMVCAPESSEYLFEAFSSEDKTLKIYPSYFHEVHNEPGHVTVIEDINNWMDSHLSDEREFEIE